jgi:hypothetical protein
MGLRQSMNMPFLTGTVPRYYYFYQHTVPNGEGNQLLIPPIGEIQITTFDFSTCFLINVFTFDATGH